MSEIRSRVGFSPFIPSLLCMLMLTACGVAPLGDGAGLSVKGQGRTVHFSWDASHPWDGQLQSQGARYKLFAQFKSGGTPVEQELGQARMVGSRQFVFDLPSTLKAPPESSVCLFASASRTSQSLPVRSRSKTGSDTARFSFPGWENIIRSSTPEVLWVRSKEFQEKAVADIGGALQARLQAHQKNGLQSREDCSGAFVATAETQKSRDVLQPQLQGEAAQRICVKRVKNLRETQLKLDAFDFIQKTSFGTDPSSERAKVLAAQIKTHSTKWDDATGDGFVPEIGSKDDFPPLSGMVIQSLKSMPKNGDGKLEERRAIAISLIDSYYGCLDDVTKQLRIKYDAWQKEQANKPARDRLYADRKRKECTASFDELDRIRVDLETAKSRLRDIEQQKPSRAANPSAAGWPMESLNQNECAI